MTLSDQPQRALKDMTASLEQVDQDTHPLAHIATGEQKGRQKLKGPVEAEVLNRHPLALARAHQAKLFKLPQGLAKRVPVGVMLLGQSALRGQAITGREVSAQDLSPEALEDAL